MTMHYILTSNFYDKVFEQSGVAQKLGQSSLNVDRCVRLPIRQRPAVPLSLHSDAPRRFVDDMEGLRDFLTINFKRSLHAIFRVRARLLLLRGFVILTPADLCSWP